MQKQDNIFKVPDNYFSSLEEDIVKVYNKKQRRKKTEIVSVFSVLTLVVIGVFAYFNNSASDNVQSLTSNITSFKDTVLQNREFSAKKKTSKTQMQSENYAKLSLQEKSSYKQSSKADNHVNDSYFSDTELNYLETYLCEDSYELLNNN